MKFEVYYRDNCPYCDLAKALLNEKDYEYSAYKIGRDINRQDVIEKFPTMKTVPIIVLDNNLIGGYSELLKWMDKNHA